MKFTRLLQLFSTSSPARRLRRLTRNTRPSAEFLERRINPASLSVTYAAATQLLTIEDTSGGSINNNISVDFDGSNIVITDSADSFISPPAIGALSGGNQILTVPKTSVSSITILSGSGTADTITQVGSLTGLSGSLNYNAERIVVEAGVQLDVAGNISLTGTGISTSGAGVLIRRSATATQTLLRTSGSSSTITISGTGGSTSNDSNIGVYIGTRDVLDLGTVLIESVDGNIQITGTGGVWDAPSTAADSNVAGLFASGTTIRTTGNGSLSLTGYGPISSTGFTTQYGDRDGINLINNSLLQTGAGGGISLIATAQGTGEAIDNEGTAAAPISAGSGGVTIYGENIEPTGLGGAAVKLQGNITAAGGAIDIEGIGSAAGSAAVSIQAPTSTNILLGIASTTSITVVGTASGGNGYGVAIDEVTATAADFITVTGTGTGTELGFNFDDSDFHTTTGNITLSGTNTGAGSGLSIDDVTLDPGTGGIRAEGIAGTTSGDGLYINAGRFGSSTAAFIQLEGAALVTDPLSTADADGIEIKGDTTSGASTFVASGSINISGAARATGEGVLVAGPATFNAGTSLDINALAVSADALDISSSTLIAGTAGINLIGSSSTNTTSDDDGIVLVSVSVSTTGYLSLIGNCGGGGEAVQIVDSSELTATVTSLSMPLLQTPTPLTTIIRAYVPQAVLYPSPATQPVLVQISISAVKVAPRRRTRSTGPPGSHSVATRSISTLRQVPPASSVVAISSSNLVATPSPLLFPPPLSISVQASAISVSANPQIPRTSPSAASVSQHLTQSLLPVAP